MSGLELFRAESPAGPLRGACRDGALVALAFDDGEAWFTGWLARRYPGEPTAEGPATEIVAALAAYAGGELTALDALRVDAAGTDFQHAVWRALRAIPAGSTVSYGALAAALGQSSAVRAVASANARNPVAIVVPCHRVIGADGTLTGYAGGLARKARLLEHERAFAQQRLAIAG